MSQLGKCHLPDEGLLCGPEMSLFCCDEINKALDPFWRSFCTGDVSFIPSLGNFPSLALLVDTHQRTQIAVKPGQRF